jgi:hypothetical protein
MSVFKLSDEEIIKIVNSIDDDSGVLIKESTLRQLIETYVNDTITKYVPVCVFQPDTLCTNMKKSCEDCDE